MTKRASNGGYNARFVMIGGKGRAGKGGRE